MAEKLAKWWSVASIFAVAVLYFLFDRRGKKMADLQEEVKREKIGRELQALAEQADRSTDDYIAARERYRALKSRHPELWGSSAAVRPSVDSGGSSAGGPEETKRGA